MTLSSKELNLVIARYRKMKSMPILTLKDLKSKEDELKSLIFLVSGPFARAMISELEKTKIFNQFRKTIDHANDLIRSGFDCELDLARSKFISINPFKIRRHDPLIAPVEIVRILGGANENEDIKSLMELFISEEVKFVCLNLAIRNHQK